MECKNKLQAYRSCQDKLLSYGKNSKLPIFLFYEHEDVELLYRLLIHLKLFRMQDQVCAWADNETNLGEDWRQRIEDSIGNARAAVLLISQHFLASPFIRQSELPRLVERRRETLLILPLIVRPCPYDLAEFPFPAASDGAGVFRLSEIQSVNPGYVPLTKLTESEQDDVFDKLARRPYATWKGAFDD
jgi:hypothetical protein